MIQRIEELNAGVYHCVNEVKLSRFRTLTGSEPLNGITWFEFAKEIFRQATELGILSKLPKITPCNTDEFPRPAERPKYSALINTKLPKMRGWREALGDYLKNQNAKMQKSKCN
jgi:dTDP-4-dehydrorhamnose reductase